MKNQSFTPKSAAIGARSAGFQPAVSRISNPQALRSTNELPTGSRRHSRLETCATSSCLGLLVLSLLLGAFSASAIRVSNSQPGAAQAKAWHSKCHPAHPNLTPAAPVTSPGSCLLRGRHPGYPAAQASPHTPRLGCGCGWCHYSWRRGVRRLEMAPPRQSSWRLTPCAVALQQLEEARRLMDPEHAREYCFAASQIIRGYIEAAVPRARAPAHHRGVPARPGGSAGNDARLAPRAAGRLPRTLRPGEVRRLALLDACLGGDAQHGHKLRAAGCRAGGRREPTSSRQAAEQGRRPACPGHGSPSRKGQARRLPYSRSRPAPRQSSTLKGPLP